MAGASAQKLRHVELLLKEPWEVALTRERGYPLEGIAGEDELLVRVANPVAFLAQKLLALLALTLVIGILVDDSIVVIENIERHRDMGKPPMQAALDGRSEIGLAALTITLVDVVVYLPVAFTSGIVGQFFRSYGLTIAVATLFSLFVSFTLTPMLAALWLKDESEPEEPHHIWTIVVADPEAVNAGCRQCHGAELEFITEGKDKGRPTPGTWPNTGIDNSCCVSTTSQPTR